MKSVVNILLIVVVLGLAIEPRAGAQIRSTIAREILERVLRDGAKRSGRDAIVGGAKKSAVETLERLAARHGDEALKVVRDGGIELLEAVPKHGDDVFDLAIKASPAARRAFAREMPELLPIARRVGVDVIELEERVPGMAAKVFSTFGDDGGKLITEMVPTKDIPRLLSYADKADSRATRELLLERYQKEGPSLFDRVPPKFVLASGLTAAMLYGTHRVTEPLDAIGDGIRDNEQQLPRAIWAFFVCGSLVIGLIVFCVLWRVGLVPRRRSASSKEFASLQPSRRKTPQQTKAPHTLARTDDP